MEIKSLSYLLGSFLSGVDGFLKYLFYAKLLLEFEAIKLTKPSKTMNKKKRTVSVDCDIGQILIITPR